VVTIVRYLTLAAVLTGCDFASPPRSPEVIPPPLTPPAPEPCRATEEGVVLCVDFEDRPLTDHAADRSPNRNDAVAVNVSTMERVPNEQAAWLVDTSSLRVGESARLDLATAFTIEMWISPNMMPKHKDGNAGLFDNYGQYTMRLQDDLKIRCGLRGDQHVDSGNYIVNREEWTHVSCRYAEGEMRVYISGHLTACRSLASVPLPALYGSAIGAELKPNPTLTAADPVDRFLGGLDNVRIYDRALDPDRICTAAGHPSGSCPADCPSGGDRDGG
jgi:concanavalin A-like lectin/glucanase superfamily protein